MYEKKFKVTNESECTVSGLFSMFESAASDHTAMLGASKDELRADGLAWMVAMQGARIERLPYDGETVTVRTYTGKTRHVFFPRYYEVFGEDGQRIAAAAAEWVIVDMKTRAFAVGHGYDLPGEERVPEFRLRSVSARMEMTEAGRFIVPPEYIDANGHMNNRRYFDVLSDHAGADLSCPLDVRIEYRSEAKEGGELVIFKGKKAGETVFCGFCGDEEIFRSVLKIPGTA